jgi:hypothetical protein
MERTAKKKTRRTVLSYRAAAAELGVNVGHLWRVIHGERSSMRLMSELKKRGIEVKGAAR